MTGPHSSPQRAPRERSVPPFSGERPGAHVQQIINGVVSFGVLLSLTDLGVADHLADRPRGVAELAGLCQTDADPLHRILRAATSLGLLRATEQPDTYALTQEGRTLRGDLADSMLPAVMMAAEPLWLEAIRVLPETVRTGRPALPQPTYEYLAGNPGTRALFHQFMRTRTAPVAAAIADLNFERVRTVVDIGGGHGTILAKILQTHPHCTGILLDRPDLAETAAEHLAALGLKDRCEVVGGDFLDHVPPGADLYLLASVVHNWSDDDAGLILQNVRKAMEATEGPTQVWCVDLLRPTSPARFGPPPMATILDVRMLSLFGGGHERTRAEYESLMAHNGLEITWLERFPNDMHLMVAGLAA